MFTQQTPWYKSISLPVTTCPFLEHSSVFKETNTEYGKHIQSQVHASDILLYASVFLETKHFHFSSWNGWAELKTLYFFQYSMNSCRNRTGQYFLKHKCMRTICSFFIYSNHKIDEFVIHLKTITCINYRTPVITESCRVNDNTAFCFI